jgi:capsular polysaccharide biosynthesis protein
MYNIIKIIMKNLRLILLMGVASAALSSYYSYFYVDKVYEASTSLYVFQISEGSGSPNRVENTYQNLMASEMLTQDYKEIIKTETVINKLLDDIRVQDPQMGQLTFEEISRNVSVNVIKGTRIIEIRMRYRDPKAAAEIANKLAQSIISEAERLTNIKSMSLLSTAHIPERPSTPNPLYNTALMTAAAMLGTAAITLLIDYIKTNIQGKDWFNIKDGF